MDTNASQNEPPILAGAPPAKPLRKKRRWWFYVLVVLGSLLGLGLAVFIAIFSYYHSLIRTYTSTKPVVLATIEPSADPVHEFISRYQEFANAIQQHQKPDPFKITADDINRIIIADKKNKNILRLIIEGDQLKAQFSVPLDQTHKKELKGRFLNGLATLKLVLGADSFLNLNVVTMDVNGKPIPRWILKKIKAKNLLSNLDSNFEFLEVLQQMDSVEVKDNAIAFTPSSSGK